MAVINYSKKEISAKIVYYGPSLCGKTTNIQSIYASLKPEQKGKLVSLSTEADRTLFFDFLPIEIGNIRGFKTRLHFYTVPGQVYYNSTRRAVLTGVDGLVFVADSQRDKMEENVESLNNLEENLNYYGKSLKTIPIIIQYNKRDLPDVTPVSEMDQIVNTYGYPCIEAVATTGEGVLETLTRITKMVLKHIEMGTSGKQQQPAIPVTEKPQPSTGSSRPPEPSPANLSEAAQDSCVQGSYEPSPARSSCEISQVFSLSDDPEPAGAAPGKNKASLGRIQIVGTESAEIISANAVQLPLRVKIEGDTRVYRMDLAIKLDGFKPEE